MTKTIKTEQVALTIAGSDPSGGAGIQADLKTFSAIGVYGAAAVSCITVQNTRGVSEVQPLAPDLVERQVNCVLEDLDVTHVKIGMLGTGNVARAVCAALEKFSGEILYDPVMISSSGHDLIDPEGLEIIRRELLPLCTVMTPNLPEISRLAEKDCFTESDLGKAAEIFFSRYGRLRVVLVTGGHFRPEDQDVTDFMFRKNEPSSEQAVHSRITTGNTHGTGCTFSAAYTAYHLLTRDDTASFRKASGYMECLLRNSTPFKIGHGNGPLMHHLK